MIEYATETMFQNNIYLIFFFVIIAIYNYEGMRTEQKISIIYLLMWVMSLLQIVSLGVNLVLLFVSMFVFLEFLTGDIQKHKILENPIFKLIDCIYLCIFQYEIWSVVIAIVITQCLSIENWGIVCWGAKVVAAVHIFWAINRILAQNYKVASFSDMMRPFYKWPINRFHYENVNVAYDILLALEDKYYYERKGTTFFGTYKIKQQIEYLSAVVGHEKPLRETIKKGARFVMNVLCGERGYSTIQMQIVRTLGIQDGYELKYRRKIFELIYTPMFISGLKRFYEKNQVKNREYFDTYLLYMYFHIAKTFIGQDYTFTPLAHAFDMKDTGTKDIDTWSPEGIFIACMGLNNRTNRLLTRENVRYYLRLYGFEFLDERKIWNMVRNFGKTKYKGEYLE